MKKAAAVRLLMAADSVAGELVRIALSKTASDADKTRAIVAILDRAGIGTKQEVDVQVSGTMELYERIVMASFVPADHEYPEGEDEFGPLTQDIIDAEIVDDADAAHDERTLERARLRDKRRRQGKQPELPPSQERRYRAPRVTIEDDPRDRPPVRDRDADRKLARERLLRERGADTSAPDPRQSRTQRSQG